MPLSLVGTFGVMYLLRFSLDNLSLMALTISTGFVVDDAIVMIENIARYIEGGEAPMQAALRGSRADRLHHHLADRLADRGADSAAVHGRRGRAAVPRIRDHAGGDDRDLRGRLADPGADDVARSSSVIAPTPSADRFDLAAERGFNKIIEYYGRALDVVLDHQTATLIVALATVAVTAWLYIVDPQGFFPGSGHGLIQAISEAAAERVVFGNDPAAAANSPT